MSKGSSLQSQRKLTNPAGRNPFAPAPNTTQGNAPARARPQAKSKVPGRPGAKAPGATAGTVGEFPRYALSPLIQTETVYFANPEVATQPGQRFSTPILFYNPDGRQVSRLDFWIRYNPELIDPVWVNVSALEPLLRASIDPEVRRSQGYIHLAGELARPITGNVQALATINWTALKPTSSTEILIEAPEGEKIGLYEGETNVLELSRIGNKGIVGMQVRIVDEAADSDRAMLEISVGEDPFLPSEREGRGVHLALVPAEEAVLPGETSTIDIALINPDLVAFDELRVRVRFDPEAVQILDADEDNYVVEGINLYDGGFHEAMPFEYHGKNSVDPARGIIEYNVGSTAGLRSYASGTVARIVYRMKRQAGSTQFWFEGLDPLQHQFLSDVRARGRSLLGPASGRAAEGLHNALVTVAPL